MTKSRQMYKTGVIHGRFQILHNDHLRYLLAGKALSKHLVVGITNPDPFLSKNEDADPNRSKPLYNPLTYYERHIMLKKALAYAGIGHDDFTIVPFPINFPERYKYYVPMDAVFFLSIYDDWGRRKLHYFRSMGIKTHVLRDVAPEKKGISATDIRHKIITGQPWEHLVPDPVPPLIYQWKLPDRLKQLSFEDH